MTVLTEKYFDEVSTLPIFSGLSNDLIRKLTLHSNVKANRDGDYLFSCGQPACFFGYVLDGTYKLSYVNQTGDELIMHFAGRGEALGIMSVMKEPTVFPFHAISKGHSRFLLIHRENFISEWVKYPEVMLRFQNDLQGRLFRSYDEKRIERLSLAERVAHLIIYLSNHKTVVKGVITVPITRREIAAYVGASIEAVIRQMSQWSSKGYIRTEDRFIEILNNQALADIAGLEVNKENNQISQCEQPLTKLWTVTSVNTVASC